MSRKPYTLSDLEYLCKYYGHETAKSLAATLGRTDNAIRNQIYMLRKSGQFDHFRNLNCYWPEIEKPDRPPQSGHKGVTWHGKWVATCQRVYLGRFKDIEEARQAVEHFKKTDERYQRKTS